MHEFVQNSVFSQRPARFVIFALGVHFLHFSAKHTSLYKAVFSARDQNVLSFSHLAHYFLAIFSKVHEFVQNNVFCPTSARFVSFALATPLFRDFQKSAEFVQNTIFSPRSECFVIFALRAPLFSFFQQSARLCIKKRFQHKISTFCHFLTGRTTF